jgi:hypothetical protein
MRLQQARYLLRVNGLLSTPAMSCYWRQARSNELMEVVSTILLYDT